MRRYFGNYCNQLEFCLLPEFLICPTELKSNSLLDSSFNTPAICQWAILFPQSMVQLSLIKLRKHKKFLLCVISPVYVVSAGLVRRLSWNVFNCCLFMKDEWRCIAEVDNFKWTADTKTDQNILFACKERFSRFSSCLVFCGGGTYKVIV